MKRSLVALAAVLVALLVLEGVVRLVAPLRPFPERRTIHIVNGDQSIELPRGAKLMTRPKMSALRDLRGVFPPGLVYEACYDGPTADGATCVRFGMNAYGLRGPELVPEKPAGVRRIACVGDSFTFGDGVAHGDTWVARLALELDANGEAWETINLGHPGYTIRDARLMLEHRTQVFAPDRILYGCFLNDVFVETSRTGSDEDREELGRLLAGEERATSGVLHGSRLWGLVAERLDADRRAGLLAEGYREAYWEGAGNWRLFRENLAAMERIARARGVPFAVVIFPELTGLEHDYPFTAIHWQLKRTCRDLGVPVVDLLEAYRGRMASELWVHPTDHHPNAEGHRLAAEALARGLGDFFE